MGTWGVGSFDDDTAMDFVEHELVEHGPIAVRRVFDEALRASDDVEVDYTLAVYTVAAAEVLAIARGNGRENESDWPLEFILPRIGEIRALHVDPTVAVAALRRVTTGASELRELATEFEDHRIAWMEHVRGLEKRLLMASTEKSQ